MINSFLRYIQVLKCNTSVSFPATSMSIFTGMTYCEYTDCVVAQVFCAVFWYISIFVSSSGKETCQHDSSEIVPMLCPAPGHNIVLISSLRPRAMLRVRGGVHPFHLGHICCVIRMNFSHPPWNLSASFSVTPDDPVRADLITWSSLRPNLAKICLIIRPRVPA